MDVTDIIAYLVHDGGAAYGAIIVFLAFVYRDLRRIARTVERLSSDVDRIKRASAMMCTKHYDLTVCKQLFDE